MMKKLSALSKKKLWLLLTAGLLAILVVMGSACAKKEPVDTSIAKSVLGDTVTLNLEDIAEIKRTKWNFKKGNQEHILSEIGEQAYVLLLNDMIKGVHPDPKYSTEFEGPTTFDDITMTDGSQLTVRFYGGTYVQFSYKGEGYVYEVNDPEKSSEIVRNFTDYSKRTPMNDPVLDAHYYEQDIAPYYHPEYFRE